MTNLLPALLHLNDVFITITTAVEPLLLMFRNESVFHFHFEVVIGAEREKEIGVNLFICTIFPYVIFKAKLQPQSLQLKKQQKDEDVSIIIIHVHTVDNFIELVKLS